MIQCYKPCLFLWLYIRVLSLSPALALFPPCQQAMDHQSQQSWRSVCNEPSQSDHAKRQFEQQLSSRMESLNLEEPAKIFRDKHGVHQFENITPDISMPGTPIHEHRQPPLDQQQHLAPETPRSMTNAGGGSSSSPSKASTPEPTTATAATAADVPVVQVTNDSVKSTLGSTTFQQTSSRPSTPSPPGTPSQFVFNKPRYNNRYMQTHFHHQPNTKKKKDTLLHDLKRLIKKSDKNDTQPSPPPPPAPDDTLSIASSRHSGLSFANEFNTDLEARYGKWGKTGIT